MTKTKIQKKGAKNEISAQKKTIALADQKVISSHKLHSRNYLELRQGGQRQKPGTNKASERVKKSSVSTLQKT